MSPKPTFTCQFCGSHEAHSCQGESPFARAVFNMLTLRPVRCHDCDALSYAFPTPQPVTMTPTPRPA